MRETHGLDQRFSNFNVHRNYLQGLVKQNVGSYSQISWFCGLVVDASVCISNKFLCSATAVGPGSTELGEPKSENIRAGESINFSLAHLIEMSDHLPKVQGRLYLKF